MSSEESKKIPLACRFIRLRASLTVERNSAVLRHCATCANCQEFFNTATQLETSLRREAVQARAIPPGSLETRVLNAVRHSRAEERLPQRQLSWSIAGLAVAALAAVLIFRIQDRSPTSQQMATVEDVIEVANELPKQWLTSLQPEAVKLLADNPLQTEIASVRSDTRSALDFLAMNFLPTGGKGTEADQPVLQPRRSS